MQAIEIKGVELLDDKEKETANQLLNEYYPKIKIKLKNILSLKAHIKEYHKEGKRKKYSIHVEAIAPAKIFEASAFDWDFARTLHKAMNKIMNEIEHRLHISNQH